MKSITRNARRFIPLVACLAVGLNVRAENGTAVPQPSRASVPVQETARLPALLQPVTLKDANGTAESGFVDPFRRRGEDGDGPGFGPGEDGLMRTTMGEISSEFRILAITIPQDTNTPRAALIQFHYADEPILVQEGDLVRVDRLGADGRGRRAKKAFPRGRTNTGGKAAVLGGRAAPSGKGVDLDEQLRKFVFYVNVKKIEPTFIEVYHNKKRPDETIRLNW